MSGWFTACGLTKTVQHPAQKLSIGMKARISNWLGAVLLLTANSGLSQGTAFTYQGRLSEGTVPANGTYDFRFAIWDAPTDGTQAGGVVTNQGTILNNGLFSAVLDFGNVFDGGERWLELAVKTNGATTFTTLLPRQRLTASPYAVFAGGANAAGLVGSIPATSIGASVITSNMLAPGTAAANLLASGQSSVPSGGIVFSSSPDATNLLALGYSRLGGPLELSWQNVAGLQSLIARGNHTAVWTGNRMIVWGGIDNNGLNPKNTGNTYDPAANSWLPIQTNGAPAAREGHTAVWTGSEMIIWGGFRGGYLNDGGRFNPTTGSWLPVAISNSPTARRYHAAVWTGSEMLVWGGTGEGDTMLNSGARYVPATDAWLPLNTTNAPAGRVLHTAVWTGNKMIVWGGLASAVNHFNDGSRYHPDSDTWSLVTTNGAPASRAYHVAVWTGNEMVVWGGQSGNVHGDGFRYIPITDAWSPISKIAAPSARYSPSVVWTGSEMVVWGGTSSGFLNDGGRYSLANDSWSVVAKTGAPDARQGHTAIWTGSEMVIFGGYNNASTFADCYSYTPSRVMYLYLRQ